MVLRELYSDLHKETLAFLGHQAGVATKQGLLDWREMALTLWPPTRREIGTRWPWHLSHHLAGVEFWNHLALLRFSRAGVEVAGQVAVFFSGVGSPRVNVPKDYKPICLNASGGILGSVVCQGSRKPNILQISRQPMCSI